MNFIFYDTSASTLHRAIPLLRYIGIILQNSSLNQYSTRKTSVWVKPQSAKSFGHVLNTPSAFELCLNGFRVSCYVHPTLQGGVDPNCVGSCVSKFC